ncbi:hypothetical protein [Marinomonas atlantica]|uniref:hypothetical protein n=1 Tax=Marinomonas atlantica TaxID=1806668 RepID=UPI00082B3827|nr:hypothetical protein [Marinomonas atlantica]
MSYGLLGMQNQMEGQALHGLRQKASIDQQNKQAEDAMDAAERQQTMTGVGTGAAIGMMAGGPMGAAIGAGVGWIASDLF